jgi:hypothetical protein
LKEHIQVKHIVESDSCTTSTPRVLYPPSRIRRTLYYFQYENKNLRVQNGVQAYRKAFVRLSEQQKPSRDILKSVRLVQDAGEEACQQTYWASQLTCNVIPFLTVCAAA